MKMTQQMSIGDYIRRMNDAQLANVLIDTITANSNCFEKYRINLGGFSFSVTNTEDLTEKLGNVVIEYGSEVAIEDGNDRI